MNWPKKGHRAVHTPKSSFQHFLESLWKISIVKAEWIILNNQCAVCLCRLPFPPESIVYIPLSTLQHLPSLLLDPRRCKSPSCIVACKFHAFHLLKPFKLIDLLDCYLISLTTPILGHRLSLELFPCSAVIRLFGALRVSLLEARRATEDSSAWLRESRRGKVRNVVVHTSWLKMGYWAAIQPNDLTALA